MTTINILAIDSAKNSFQVCAVATDRACVKCRFGLRRV